MTTDTEGFDIDPRPPLRVNDPASYATALAEVEDVPEPCTDEAKVRGCTYRSSQTLDRARAVGLPWWFGAMDCPVHGGR